MCSGHSCLHLILSFSLLTLTEEAKKSLLRSLLLVAVVNYCHLLVEGLTSFYSHTKDTFCHLWLLQGTLRGPVSIPWRWENTGKQWRPRNIFPASYSSSRHLWQLYKLVPKCARTVPSALFFVTDINPQLSVCSKSGLSQPVSYTIVPPTEP